MMKPRLRDVPSLARVRGPYLMSTGGVDGIESKEAEGRIQRVARVKEQRRLVTAAVEKAVRMRSAKAANGEATRCARYRRETR